MVLGVVLPYRVRYYRGTVVPQPSAVPTTAPSQEVYGSGYGTRCRTTVLRYYHTGCGTTVRAVLPRSQRYYRPSRSRQHMPPIHAPPRTQKKICGCREKCSVLIPPIISP